jgi:hypothetical protein
MLYTISNKCFVNISDFIILISYFSHFINANLSLLMNDNILVLSVFLCFDIITR